MKQDAITYTAELRDRETKPYKQQQKAWYYREPKICLYLGSLAQYSTSAAWSYFSG